MGHCKIIGSGKYLPDKIVTSEELEIQFGLRPGWIERNTGIRERRYAEEPIEDMYAKAALEAVRESRQKVDTIITCRDIPADTRNSYVPGAIYKALDREGLIDKNCDVLDGFLYCGGSAMAIDDARIRIQAGQSKSALVVAGSKSSDFISPADKGSSVLWGDGAGALHLASSDKPGYLASKSKFRPIDCGSLEKDSEGRSYFRMHGREVYRFVVECVPKLVMEVLASASIDKKDVRTYVFHQANQKMLDAVARELGLEEGQSFSNISRYGNTIGASFLIAYDEAVKTGRIREGDLFMLCGFGVGMLACAMLYRK